MTSTQEKFTIRNICQSSNSINHISKNFRIHLFCDSRGTYLLHVTAKNKRDKTILLNKTKQTRYKGVRVREYEIMSMAFCLQFQLLCWWMFVYRANPTCSWCPSRSPSKSNLSLYFPLIHSFSPFIPSSFSLLFLPIKITHL